MPAFLHFGAGPLKKEAVGDRQQRWPEKDTDEAKGDDDAKEPEETEQHGQVVGFAEDIGFDDVVDAANEEQAPCSDEQAPPNGSLDKKPQRHRAPHKRGADRHERQDEGKETKQ